MPRGFGAQHDFPPTQIAGATIASRARRGRGVGGLDPAGDDDVSRAHARCRAAAERVETRATTPPTPPACRSASRRRAFSTPRAGTCHLGRMAREAIARDGKRLETQPRVHADVPVDVERRRRGRRRPRRSRGKRAVRPSSASGPGSPVGSLASGGRRAARPAARGSGEPVRAFTLGGNRETGNVRTCDRGARGVNYFFASWTTRPSTLPGRLRVLCSDPRTPAAIFVAGAEDFTDREKVTDHVAKCLARLGTDYVDAFMSTCRGRGRRDRPPSSGCARGGLGGDRPGGRRITGRCVSWGAARTTGASG